MSRMTGVVPMSGQHDCGVVLAMLGSFALKEFIIKRRTPQVEGAPMSRSRYPCPTELLQLKSTSGLVGSFASFPASRSS